MAHVIKKQNDKTHRKFKKAFLSLQTVLTMLNFVNGILFMHTQEEELDRIKDELLRLQQNGVIPSINNTNKSSMAATAAAAAVVTSETSISKNTVKINAQDDDLQ